MRDPLLRRQHATVTLGYFIFPRSIFNMYRPVPKNLLEIGCRVVVVVTKGLSVNGLRLPQPATPCYGGYDPFPPSPGGRVASGGRAGAKKAPLWPLSAA